MITSGIILFLRAIEQVVRDYLKCHCSIEETSRIGKRWEDGLDIILFKEDKKYKNVILRISVFIE